MRKREGSRFQHRRRSAVFQENSYRSRSDVRAGSDRQTGARASVNTRRARVVIFRVDLSGRESCARSGPRTGEEWSSVVRDPLTRGDLAAVVSTRSHRSPNADAGDTRRWQ